MGTKKINSISTYIKYSLWLLILFALLVALPAYGKDGKTYGDIQNVVYIGNYDGDTITVDIPSLHPIIGDNITVRVYGVDTPEIKGKCQQEKDMAEKAKALVKDALAKSRIITLKDIRRDKYFRILAIVIADEIDISELLVRQGLAIRYYGGTKEKDWCK